MAESQPTESTGENKLRNESLPPIELTPYDGPFRDEALAPEVDRPLVRALVRRELSPADARCVYQLIHSFQSWRDAHVQILTEEFS